jgi:hypothetical protein
MGSMLVQTRMAFKPCRFTIETFSAVSNPLSSTQLISWKRIDRFPVIWCSRNFLSVADAEFHDGFPSKAKKARRGRCGELTSEQ